MPNYRWKNPVTVQAWQFDGTQGCIRDIQAAIPGAKFEFEDRPVRGGKALRPSMHIPTYSGRQRALVGDWIVWNESGGAWICDAQTFESVYEPVDD